VRRLKFERELMSRLISSRAFTPRTQFESDLMQARPWSYGNSIRFGDLASRSAGSQSAHLSGASVGSARPWRLYAHRNPPALLTLPACGLGAISLRFLNSRTRSSGVSMRRCAGSRLGACGCCAGRSVCSSSRPAATAGEDERRPLRPIPDRDKVKSTRRVPAGPFPAS